MRFPEEDKGVLGEDLRLVPGCGAEEVLRDLHDLGVDLDGVHVGFGKDFIQKTHHPPSPEADDEHVVLRFTVEEGEEQGPAVSQLQLVRGLQVDPRLEGFLPVLAHEQKTADAIPFPHADVGIAGYRLVDDPAVLPLGCSLLP